MKYVADDGTIFETEGECREHEELEKLLALTGHDVEQFLKDTKPENSARSNMMYRRVIGEWERWKNTSGVRANVQQISEAS